MSISRETSGTNYAELKQSVRLLQDFHPDWQAYGEFFDAYLAADPVGLYRSGPDEISRMRLIKITERARAESLPVMYEPARVRVACFVGLTRIAKRLSPECRAAFFISYLRKLARETPFMFDDAVVYGWRGFRKLERLPLGGILDVAHIQPMIDEAGSLFCARIVTDYLKAGWKISCSFPAIERLVNELSCSGRS